MTTILQARPRQFVNTPAIDRVAKRALRYLQSGYSVHLQGPAGTGKTTLALHLADLLTRPIMLLFGDDEFKTSDLIGNQSGFTRKKVFDNFIHSVVKMEDEVRQNWVDSRLTLACREGFTLVYDEFNRSRPEVNNVLLSALEEKLLVLPPNNSRSEYIRVNPHFRAILTSNPSEYCGVHATQDALLDRLITITMPEPDELTQQEILVQKIDISRESATLIVQLVKAFRLKASTKDSSGLRSCLMIAKICKEHGIEVFPGSTDFRELCQDILLARSGKSTSESNQILWDLFNTYHNFDIVPHVVPGFTAEPNSTNASLDKVAKDVDVSVPLSKILSHPEYEQVGCIGEETLDEIFGDEESVELGETAIAPDVIQEAMSQVETLGVEPHGLPILEETDTLSDEFYSIASEFSSESAMIDPEGAEPDVLFIISDPFNAQAPVVDEPMVNESVVNEPAANPVNEPVVSGFLTDASVDSESMTDEFEVTETVANALVGNEPEASELEVAELSSAESITEPGQAADTFIDANAQSIDRIDRDGAIATIEPGVPFEQEVYEYLQRSQDARPSQIESALGITRFQTVNALRSLTDKGLVASQRHPNGHSHPINGHIRGHILPPQLSGMMVSQLSGGDVG